MPSVKDVAFRFSTPEDYQAICSIDIGILSSKDYIVEKYHSYLKEPGFFGAVAELNGEVIGFGAVVVQMSGTKLFSRAGRVKEKYRNKGIYGQIKAFFREALKKAGHPDLKVEEFMTRDTNPSIPRIIRSGKYTRVFQRAFLNYTLTAASQMAIEASGCKEIHAKEIGLREILENETLSKSFFPKRVFIGYMSFEPAFSELDQIESYQPYVVASLTENGSDPSQLMIGISSDSKCYVIQWVVASHTDNETASRGFQAIIIKQLKRMLRVNDGGCCVIMFDCAHKEKLKSVGERYKLCSMTPYAEYQVGFRRDI